MELRSALTGAELGKRRKREEGSGQSVAQETGKVHCSNAPAGKTGKGAEKRTKKKTQRRVTKRGKRKRTEEGCNHSVSQGTSTEAPAGKKEKTAVDENRRKSPRQRRVSKTDTFASRYNTAEKLGQGSFGTVFKGSRISDGLEVAVKFVLKQPDDEYVQIPDEPRPVPREVAVLQMMSQPPVCSNIVQLIEWFDQPSHYILVLERPDPCVDLSHFLRRFGGSVSEEAARAIMLQAVEAVRQCCLRGVVHRDIKLENFLINTDTLEVKLIDFGCSDWIRKSGFHVFEGTLEYYPPEFFIKGRYHARSAAVWSLGVLLFTMVCGRLPFTNKRDIVNGLVCFEDGLSNGEPATTCETTTATEKHNNYRTYFFQWEEREEREREDAREREREDGQDKPKEHPKDLK